MKKILLSFSLVTTFIYAQVPYQVKDICPGSCQATNLSGSTHPFVYNNKVLFAADDGVNGQELWISDGSAAGTNMVKNIAPGNLWATPSSFYIYNSKVYFQSSGGMWVTDGTTVNTNSVSPLCYSGKPFEHNSIMYWTGGITGTGQELVRSDGTTGGTYVLKDIWPGVGNSFPSQHTSASGPNFFFVANDGTAGEELWYSDGTSGGTAMVKDIRPGSAASTITILRFISGILYFQANDGVTGKELWRSDGTTVGTFMLKDFTPGSGSMGVIRTHQPNNNKLFFGYGANVWESDGSIVGTVTNTLIPTTSTWSGIQSNLYIFNNDLYYYSGVIDFSMTSLWDSISLYKITNSVSNTSLVKKMKPASNVGNSYFSIFQTNAGKFITLAEGGPGNYGCFIASDGTSGGTGIASCKSVSYLNNSGLFIPYYNPIPFLNNAWYYPLYDSPSGGYQIHKIDASTYSVSLLTTIGSGNFYNGPSCGFWGYFHEMLCNNFLFWANDGSTGIELWASDGTTSGTNLALDIYPGSNTSIPSGCDDFARYAVTSNKFYFYAYDGVSGDELWAVNLCGALGVNENGDNNSLEPNVYPNPANNLLNIKTSDNTIKSIEVINTLGQTVIKQVYSDKIDISGLAKGYYTLQMSGDKTYYSKFIKE